MVPNNASLSGSSLTTITIQNFQPDVEQQSNVYCDSPQRYCGAQSFPIILGAQCQVMVNVDDVTYDTQSCAFISASASVGLGAPQTCTLATDGGPLTMSVQSGTVSSTMSSVQFTFSGALSDGSGSSATVQFQGS
jgi:hypothetical protein